MNTRELEYIIMIAREGSLSQAARRLGVSQPTLSTFLSNLERQLGIDLFLREKKHMILTPAGKIYLDAARKILQVKDQTYQSIHRLTQEATETITIGATPLRGSIMVAQIFPQFSKRFPNVKLEIKEAYMTELRDLVRAGAVNCALGSCLDTESPEFDYITISKEEVVLGVPSFHRLAPLASQPGLEPLASPPLSVNSLPSQSLSASSLSAEPHSVNRHRELATIDVGQLADSPFVLLSPGTTVRAITNHIFAKAGFQPTIVFETNNNLVLSNMIRQGAGVGFLPRSAMVTDAADVVYFSISPKYYITLCIILSKNRVLTEAERYFAYLTLIRDNSNPLYTPSNNALARNILREFHEKDVIL
ncbi:MAG: LysR family transcriptional regulator [Lachnospiraceae bacterium]|nr:LysR family transcriptional regulator [Lachnospiraceae bacterium]